MFKLLILLVLIFQIFSKLSFSQDSPPIEWGKVPQEDLLMTTFPEDSNASAVILCDYGVSRFNDNLDIVFDRHLRIKILNEKGYELGTHSIDLYTKADEERLYDLEAITYILDKNGEVIENELDDDNVFEEEISDSRTRYKFTMPALTPGCVIDIKYTIIANSIFDMRGWTFQYSEPVIWSEYRAIIPINIAYAFVSSGYEPWYIVETTNVDQVFAGNAQNYLGKSPIKCNQYRWAIHKAPALRNEPYITTISDYQNKVDAQLAGYAFIGIGREKVLRDWKSVVEELLKSESFMDRIEVTGDVEDITAEVTKGLNSAQEKLEAIYKWITNSIVWNESHDIFADQDVDDVLEYKKGNSAEINFLLLSMLKSAGIDGDPVILSTRRNGRLKDIYPIVSQFNLAIIRVKLDSKIYFIDATDPLRPLNVLPEKILNVKGLIVKKGDPEWVIISSQDADSESNKLDIHLNEDGLLTSDINVTFGEYESLSIRKSLKNKTEKEIIKDVFDFESLGFNIDSVKVLNKDNIDLPLKIEGRISSADYIQKGGNLIYLNPVLINRLADNPFKDKDRKFSVDYSYPRTESTITNIILPQGYELKEKFEDRFYTISNDASYQRNLKMEDNHIQISRKLDIKNSNIKPEIYPRLKDFYSEVIATDSEMLIIGTKEK